MSTSRPPNHRPATPPARPRRRRALAVGVLLLPMLLAFGAAPGAASASEPAPGATGEAIPGAAGEPSVPSEPAASGAVETPAASEAPPASDPVETPGADPTATPTVEPPAGEPVPTPTPDAPSATPVVESPAVEPAPPPATTEPTPATPRATPPATVPAAGAVASKPPTRATAPESRLGTADTFAILAGSTITNTGRSVVTGNVGLHPGSAVTGFGSCTGLANCVDLTGDQHIANGVAQQAKADLLTAYDTLVGLEGTCTPLVVELGGTTLTPGVYCSPTFGLTGTLTLSGVGEFVFLTGAGGSTLTTAPDSAVRLIDGADRCGVYWQVASSATLGAGTAFAGNILARTSISFGADATLAGSALAQTGAVTLISNTITDSACGAADIPPGDDETPPDDGETPDDGEAPPGDDDGTPGDTDGEAGPLPAVGTAGGAGSGGSANSGGSADGRGLGLRAGGHRSLPATGSPVGLQLLLVALTLGTGVVMTAVGARLGRVRR